MKRKSIVSLILIATMIISVSGCGSKEKTIVLTEDVKSEPIPEEVFNNRFDPFIKHSKTNNRDSRGLGLYLCKEIIKEHEGAITIENGTMVKIKISLMVQN